MMHLQDGARYDVSHDGSREHLVTRHEAQAGMLVTLSRQALDTQKCEMADYFRQYQGMVGELLRPWNDDQLAWFARFPGYPQDIFSTGGADGFQLAYAPKGSQLGAVPSSSTSSSSSSAAAAKAAVASVLAEGGNARMKSQQSRLDAMLMNATISGDFEVVAAAVAAGGDVNVRSDAHNNMTCLHLAITNLRPLLAARLIALGASTRACDNVGAAALHHAAVVGDSDTVSALLLGGASLSQSTLAGLAPLHLAARNGMV
jgi:hypothetical protein